MIAGNFLVNLTFASTAPNGNVAAALWDGDGLTDGASACLEDLPPTTKLLQLANSDLRHRGYLEIGSDYPVGTPDEVRLISRPLAKVVPAGSHIILVVGAGTNGYVPKPYQPVLTLSTGPGVVADVSFTVVEGELRFAESGQGAAAGPGTLVPRESPGVIETVVS